MADEKVYITVDGCETEITDIEDINVIRNIFDRQRIDILSTRTVKDLCTGNFQFYIASYQRGYRWEKDEVEMLLNDIFSVYHDSQTPQYCLQPLVVRKRYACKYSTKLSKGFENNNDAHPLDECYELLDGQQRLTTIWLILSQLNVNKTYQIFYELTRYVDKKFIEFANKTIYDWINKNLKEEEKDNFLQTILEKLTFIWFEVSDAMPSKQEKTTSEEQNAENQKSESLFRKINKGKIELTNAELFKAMLLNDEETTEEQRQKLEQISFEWDKIEQSLRNDDFWFFISNETSDERTRIDFILEVYARSIKKQIDNDKHDVKFKEYFSKSKKTSNYGSEFEEYYNNLDKNKDRYSFLVVNKYIDYCKTIGKDKTIKDIWEEVVEVHDKLCSWYLDDELYHNIGFLVACESRTRAVASEIIVELYTECKNLTIAKVKEKVLDKIKNRFEGMARRIRAGGSDNTEFLKDLNASDIDYDTTKTSDLQMFLLYSNIYPIVRQIRNYENKRNGENIKDSLKEIDIARFPFKMYYQIKWDIEHINPKEPIVQIDNALQMFDSEAEKEEYKKAINEYLQKKKQCSIDDLNKNLQEEWDKNKPENGSNAVRNLVLLDSTTNRQYHNAIFGYKRHCIIERDKEGKYILPQTKKVFLKYDSINPTFIEWTKDDQDNYERELNNMLDFVKNCTSKAEGIDE